MFNKTRVGIKMLKDAIANGYTKEKVGIVSVCSGYSCRLCPFRGADCDNIIGDLGFFNFLYEHYSCYLEESFKKTNMDTLTRNGIELLKNAIANGYTVGGNCSAIFCEGITCIKPACPVYSMCGAGSAQKRFEYLYKHYSHYLEDIFEEGEEVEVSDSEEKGYIRATYLYKDKNKRTWVKVEPHRAEAYLFCRKKKPSVKKVTIDEIEEKFGCKVDIVND